MDIEAYFEKKREKINEALDEYLPSANKRPTKLHKAMRYSIFAGGKRIRPILALAAAEAVGRNATKVMPIACAIEMVHTYSLIHDDLPQMDNDSLRRGRPTCHKVFGTAIAILTGDTLLSEAFAVISKQLYKKRLEPKILLQVINDLSKAISSSGMTGGQTMDIESRGIKIAFPLLEYIHIHKTGSLILASILAGARIAKASASQIRALSKYGESIGLAFQITDDILNVTGNKKKMGKRVGSDKKGKKATYPAFLGLEESIKRANELKVIAISALKNFTAKANPLREIAEYIVARDV